MDQIWSNGLVATTPQELYFKYMFNLNLSMIYNEYLKKIRNDQLKLILIYYFSFYHF